ncbi:MAG TPA: class F sortase [Thermomicrobiales bacterium]|nr:class F sortase [Thermomicrobiales bacterium]
MPGILYNERDLRYSRRRIVGSALVLAGGAMFGRSVAAQDEDAEIVPIQSTELGPMPSTGTVRGGFVGDQVGQQGVVAGVQPAALVIEKAQIDAEVEVQQIADGVMLNPSGPWIVSWYEQTAALGEIGNVVMAGHVDYWNVGPSVFFNLRDLVEGDQVEVIGENQTSFLYTVEWNETFDLEELTSGRITELVGPTEDPVLTLITCGGEFDYASGEYLSRTVVRANLVES